MHDLSLHILDLIENSLNANAKVISITIEINSKNDSLTIRVEDNGKGLSVPGEQAVNPFYTTSVRKKVGLGLSLLHTTADMSEGRLSVSSSKALGGVCVEVVFKLSHINRPPLGDLPSTISTMVLANPGVDFQLEIISDEKSYFFSSTKFARENGISIDANIKLANKVFSTLCSHFNEWNEYSLVD